MRLIKFIDKLLNFIAIMFFITIISFSAYALYDINQVYNDAKLSEDILKYRPEEQQDGEVVKFNLADIQNEINEDICGWLRIDGTNIDYPILYPHTSLQYLDKDYKKNYSPAGSIFIDYKNNRLFKDDYTVIYGHNMAEKRMFSDIKEFQNIDFFKSHSTGKLYTSDKIYNIKIYSFNVLDSNTDIAYKVTQYSNGKNTDLIENFKKSAVHRRDYDIDSKSQIAILTTCNGAGTSQRAVLFCVLEECYNATETINEEEQSDIEKDQKVDEAKNAENKKKSTTIKKNDELTKGKKSNKKYNEKWDRAWYYVKRDLRNPVKLSLYILILITISIYIIIVAKKIKNKRKKIQAPDKEIKLKNKTKQQNSIKNVRTKDVKVKAAKVSNRGKGKHSL